MSHLLVFAIIGIGGAVIGLVLLILLFQRLRDISARLSSDQSMVMLNQNMIGVQERLDKTSSDLNQRLDNAARVIQGVQKELSTFQEIGRGIKEFQEMLNSPKLRGNIGEHILTDSLSQIFPRDLYEVQYQFREGQTVDAIVRTDQGVIPIDSKFPMENFRKMIAAEDTATKNAERKEALKAVKKHIDDIAKKYILPAEGTVDFAVMYVPSESIFYEVMMAEEEIMEFARAKKILLVSPNSFFHFLRVIMMGLERVKLQKEAQRIWELLKGIQQEASKFGDTLGLTNKHLTNAKNAMDSSVAEYSKLSNRIDQVKLLE